MLFFSCSSVRMLQGLLASLRSRVLSLSNTGCKISNIWSTELKASVNHLSSFLIKTVALWSLSSFSFKIYMAFAWGTNLSFSNSSWKFVLYTNSLENKIFSRPDLEFSTLALVLSTYLYMWRNEWVLLKLVGVWLAGRFIAAMFFNDLTVLIFPLMFLHMELSLLLG